MALYFATLLVYYEESIQDYHLQEAGHAGYKLQYAVRSEHHRNQEGA